MYGSHVIPQDPITVVLFWQNPQVTLLSMHPGLEVQVVSWDFVAAPDTVTFLQY